MRAVNLDNGMTEGNLLRQQFLFFGPILLGLLFQQLYTTVDAAIVGRFAGKEGLAAIDATASLIRLFVNFFVGLSTGASILVSQQHGAGEESAIADTLHTAVAFSVLGGAVLAAFGALFAPAGVLLMRVPEDIRAHATVYIRYYALGLFPSMVYNMGAGILRATGETRKPVLFLIVGGIINVALDLLFIGRWGMGVAGAAIATAIAQAVTMALVLRSLAKSKGVCSLVMGRIRIQGEVLKNILRKGLPIGLQSAMYPISNMVIHARINVFGTNTVAAWAVCGKLDLPIWLTMDALAVTISTFAAQNYGAGRYSRVKASVGVSIGIALVVIVPLSLTIFFFGKTLSGIFVRDQEVITLSASLLRFYALFFFTYIWGEVLAGAIRGTGNTFVPMVITLLCTCLFRILWIAFLVPELAQVEHVVAVYPATWIVTSLAFIAYYPRHMRKLRMRMSA